MFDLNVEKDTFSKYFLDTQMHLELADLERKNHFTY